MAATDYRLMNGLLVVGLVAFLLFIFIKSSGDPIMCGYFTTTGEYCRGCGLTRDFHSFMKLDFDEPISTGSVSLFTYYILQLCFRSMLMIIRPNARTNTNKVSSEVLVFDAAFTLGGAIAVVLSFFVTCN